MIQMPTRRDQIVDKLREELGPIAYPVMSCDIIGRRDEPSPNGWGPPTSVDSRPAPRYQGILRTDTNELVSVMSDRYTLVPNETLIETTVQELGDFGHEVNVTKAELLNGGRQFFTELTFPNLSFTPDDGLEVGMQLLMGGSYDGTKRIWFQLGSFRFVCSNGMVVGTTLLECNQKHMGQNVMEQILNTIQGNLVPQLEQYQHHMGTNLLPIVNADKFQSFTKLDKLSSQLDAVRKPSILGWSDEVEAEVVEELGKALPLVPKRSRVAIVQACRTQYGLGVEGRLTKPWNFYNLCTYHISRNDHGRLSEFKRAEALSCVHRTVFANIQRAA
jgi:hypothetical protein